MANPSKQKGTAAETAAVRWFRAHGFPHTDRQPLRGNRDSGDLTLTVGLVVEVKAHALAGKGQAPPALLATWMRQCEAERAAAGADYCPLVVKRSGTTDVARWWAYLPALDVASLLGAQLDVSSPLDPMCTSVETLARLLRAAGYGTPLPEVSP